MFGPSCGALIGRRRRRRAAPKKVVPINAIVARQLGGFPRMIYGFFFKFSADTEKLFGFFFFFFFFLVSFLFLFSFFSLWNRSGWHGGGRKKKKKSFKKKIFGFFFFFFFYPAALQYELWPFWKK